MNCSSCDAVSDGLKFCGQSGNLCHIEENNRSARFKALTPEQQHGETVKNCIELRRDWASKLYSELTPEERKLKFSCEVILAK